MNDNPNFLMVAPNQAYKIRNCHLDARGMAFSRRGSRRLNATALNGAVRGIYEWRRPSGTSTVSTIIIVAGLKVYSYVPATDTAVVIATLSGTGRPTFASFQNSSGTPLLFIANGTEFKKWDGTTFADACADEPWTSAPRYIKVYGDRMLAAGCDSDPYKVFISASLDGTDFKPAAGPAASYWTVSNIRGERVSGITTYYNFGVFFTKSSVTIITGADPGDTGTAQIIVSHEYGTTSHWSIQSIGSNLFFSDESHVYRGYLRDAIENGLLVTPCDDGIEEKYDEKTTSADIQSVYDPANGEMWFCMSTDRLLTNARKDTALVYNLHLSGNLPEGYRDTWSGYFDGTGFEVYAVALVNTPVAALTYDERKMQGVTGTEYPYVWRGDEDGYVYVCGEHEYYTDHTGYVVSEIVTGAIAPYGIGYQKYAREFAPMVYQRYKDAIQVQWLIDGRYELPDTTYTIELENTVPYWTDGTTYPDLKETWGSTVWNDFPVMPVLISIDEPFNYIQFRLKCNGTNARDAVAYSGGELYYQLQGVQRPVG